MGAVLAGTFLPLVLTGLHQGLVPIHVELVQAHGYNALFPIGDGGRWSDRRGHCRTDENPQCATQKVIKGALPVGLLGIGEPLILASRCHWVSHLLALASAAR